MGPFPCLYPFSIERYYNKKNVGDLELPQMALYDFSGVIDQEVRLQVTKGSIIWHNSEWVELLWCINQAIINFPPLTYKWTSYENDLNLGQE